MHWMIVRSTSPRPTSTPGKHGGFNSALRTTPEQRDKDTKKAHNLEFGVEEASRPTPRTTYGGFTSALRTALREEPPPTSYGGQYVGTKEDLSPS